MGYHGTKSGFGWVKSNAKFWSEGQVGDSVQGLQYLIQTGMIKVTATQLDWLTGNSKLGKK